MKKSKIFLIISLIIISSICIYFSNKKEYLSLTDILGIYINDELNEQIPAKESAMFQKAVCDDENVKVTWDNDNWGLLISNLNKKVKCNLYFYSGPTVFDFDYTGSEQIFTAPVSGIYKLETWGAQGGSSLANGEFGNYGGYGGYSEANINLNKNQNIYAYVGGAGENAILENDSLGGYNGGGLGTWDKSDDDTAGGGGGATDFRFVNGNYENDVSLNSRVIVAGGGGGSSWTHLGGAGGGFKGNVAGLNGLSATQTSGYKLGLGESATGVGASDGIGGGGGGYYGGFCGIGSKFNDGTSGADDIGGGGSGYIGNSLLKNKVMYCYNCEESSEEDTKTISTTCSEETPTTNCAKKGNGYARITLVSIDE